ncbi:MAG TPA: hypothetical protein DCR55_07100 [Lentisphaeria bacterium]|nr:hypothetical protein [Lentisphaeria bacterium]
MRSQSRARLVFDNAFSACSPAGDALLSGKQIFRTGTYTVPVLERGGAEENIFSRWTLEQRHKIYAQPMADVGYQGIISGTH